jgi:hypothetical protein
MNPDQAERIAHNLARIAAALETIATATTQAGSGNPPAGITCANHIPTRRH